MMSDPLEVLRSNPSPVAPDPMFAQRLRARLDRALRLPEGVPMSDPTTTETELPTLPAAIPYLAVHDAREAIDWYVAVFGATVEVEPIVMPDGRVGHSELRVGRAVLYLSDAHPELGVVAPTPGAASISLMLLVDDTDAVLARVERSGGHRDHDRAPYDGHGERNAWIIDPFGHRWGLHSPL